MNVLLLSIDCLRFDHVNPGLTPNISDFSDRSRVYDNCLSNGTFTRDALQNMIAGSFPSHHGGSGIAESQTPVSELLQPTHRTGLFHSNPNLQAGNGYYRGFDSVFDFDTLDDFNDRWDDKNPVRTNLLEIASALNIGPGSRLWDVGKGLTHSVLGSQNTINYQPYATAEETVSRFQEWRPDEQYFAWLHFMDPHLPYTPREEYVRDRVSEQAIESAANRNLKEITVDGEVPYDFTDEEITAFQELYRAEVAYLDDVLGDLFESLSDDTVVVFTADHGEYLFDNAYKFGHFAGIYDEIVRVPLIVSHPDMDAGTDSGLTTVNDIPSTIADVAGVAPPDSYRGRSLLTDPDREIAVGERTGGRENEPYLVYAQHGGDRVGYYPDDDRWVELDRSTGDVDDISREAVDGSVVERIELHLSETDLGRNEQFTPDEEVQDRLEQLGYKQ